MGAGPLYYSENGAIGCLTNFAHQADPFLRTSLCDCAHICSDKQQQVACVPHIFLLFVVPARLSMDCGRSFIDFATFVVTIESYLGGPARAPNNISSSCPQQTLLSMPEQKQVIFVISPYIYICVNIYIEQDMQLLYT